MFQAPNPDARETPPIRPLESDADVSVHNDAGRLSNVTGTRDSWSSSREMFHREFCISPLQVLLTRLCGCDKLLQSLSEELAQLQMDKVATHSIQNPL